MDFAKFFGTVSSFDQLLCQQKKKGIAKSVKNLVLMKNLIILSFGKWLLIGGSSVQKHIWNPVERRG